VDVDHILRNYNGKQLEQTKPN